ncbi:MULTISPECIES: glyoxalase superfamily protein [Cryobacterium]|uniref:Glyoxalase n=1 Tax=Cryobacterium zongtaii TaxID=1259217 RepID=A0A2S3ZA74_9MICO|nr:MULTISPECIES: glyoxalase superfamily protein [Cryobacterium]POH62478.1 glyoxalase [Cryobacterium zongtaii]POH66241.1 glyoxalase [Cryobacterium zongtaii]TFC46909.1 glyoxalase [Cryobacterium sp. TMN-39-2]TFC50019.1 glyoxalase [Cryobacterium sp. TMB3-1-2]TFC57671.1 glyoxalase [Cryobacterium sp. TMB1-7]
MDMKIELVSIPVTDVDRAKAFYVDQVGFNADYDQRVNEAMRFVQLTPPGSACSIVLGEGMTDMPPGSQRGVQMVVADADAARAQLVAAGVEASEVDEQDWGRFVYFSDPDGNTWSLQQLPPPE